MPIYKYFCRNCRNSTEKLFMRADSAPTTFECPVCLLGPMRRIFQTFRQVHKPTYMTVRDEMYPGLSETDVTKERKQEDIEYYAQYGDIATSAFTEFGPEPDPDIPSIWELAGQEVPGPA